jgi:hypothetical protein
MAAMSGRSGRKALAWQSWRAKVGVNDTSANLRRAMKVSTHLVLLVGVGCAAVALIYGMASHLDKQSGRLAVHCPETRSLDGTKSLSLWPDGEADLSDPEQSIVGRWSFEKAIRPTPSPSTARRPVIA